jgi:putative hydrolase of the HAD superfamily
LKLVWDFGAVLFRWQPAALLKQLLPRHAFDDASAERWREALFGAFDGDWARFDRGVVDTDEVVRAMAQRHGIEIDEVRTLIGAIPAQLAPIEETWALVRELGARGASQYFLSNMPAPYADFLDQTHADRFAQFEVGLYSSRVHLCKPEAVLFALAEQRFGLVPAQTLFFDDHLANVEAARARGWHAVQVTGPDAVAEGLRQHRLT